MSSFINKRVQFIGRKRTGRTPSNAPLDGAGVPLRITRLFPMKLKDVTIESIEGKKQGKETACMPEMMSLFECLERNEFNDKPCLGQAKTLENCYSTHMIEKRTAKALRQQKAK